MVASDDNVCVKGRKGESEENEDVPVAAAAKVRKKEEAPSAVAAIAVEAKADVSREMAPAMDEKAAASAPATAATAESESAQVGGANGEEPVSAVDEVGESSPSGSGVNERPTPTVLAMPSGPPLKKLRLLRSVARTGAEPSKSNWCVAPGEEEHETEHEKERPRKVCGQQRLLTQSRSDSNSALNAGR